MNILLHPFAPTLEENLTWNQIFVDWTVLDNFYVELRCNSLYILSFNTSFMSWKTFSSSSNFFSSIIFSSNVKMVRVCSYATALHGLDVSKGLYTLNGLLPSIRRPTTGAERTNERTRTRSLIGQWTCSNVTSQWCRVECPISDRVRSFVRSVSVRGRSTDSTQRSVYVCTAGKVT